MSSVPMVVALALYGIATCIYMVYLARLDAVLARFGRIVLLLAAVAHLAGIGTHHLLQLPPEVTTHSGLLELSVFVMVAAYLFISMFIDMPVVGALISPVATVVVATLWHHGLQTEAGQPPHLASIRFVTPVHIASSVLGFACFGVSFGASVLRVIADLRLRQRLPDLWPGFPPISTLDRVAYIAVRCGFPFYTFGIVLGVVWAFWANRGERVLTGEYLLGVGVWVLYATMIYLFVTTGWRGRKAAILNMIAFIATIPIVLMYGLRRWG